MSVVRYGRVFLNCVRTNFYKREAVYNGNDYLYTKHLISWRVVISPQTQADLYTGAAALRPNPPRVTETRSLRAGATLLDGPVVVATFDVKETRPTRIGLTGPLVSPPGQIAGGGIINGLDGAMTQENLKSTLMQPRQVLQWWINGQPVLISPLPGFVSDSAGGPKPVSFDIVEFSGSRTWVADYCIECCINEGPRFSTIPSPVLSNQWSQTDELGLDLLCTRTTEGVAVFDKQVLATPFVYGASAVLADQLRSSLFPEIPTGWRRESIKVRMEPDGVTCQWMCVDRETNVVIGDNLNLVTDVQARHTISLDSASADVEGAISFTATQSVKQLYEAALDVIKGSGGPVAARIQAAIAFAAGKALTARQILVTPSLRALDEVRYGMQGGGIAAVRAATLSHHLVEVSIAGKKQANRTYLDKVCRALMIDRISYMKTLPRLLLKASSTYDLTAARVDASCLFLGGPIEGQNVNDPLPQAWRAETYRPEGVNRTQFGTESDQGAKPVLGQYATATLPSDGLSRGSAVQALVTAALTNPYDRRPNLGPGSQPPAYTVGNPPPINTGAATQVNAPGWPRTAPRI